MTRGTDVTQFKLAYRTRNTGEFPERVVIELDRESLFKYGENPAQHAAGYVIRTINGEPVLTIPEATNLRYVRTDDQGKGGLSVTNLMDITRAMEVLKFFPEYTATIMKHNIVAGFATRTSNQSQDELFRLARDADLRSAFGGTLVVNTALDMATAEAMYELQGQNPFFVDVVAAPEYDEGVISYLERRSKTIRIGQFSGLSVLPKFQGDNTHGLYSFKEMPTGRIAIQDLYLTSIKGPESLIYDPMIVEKESGIQHIVQTDPTQTQIADLLTAWYINVAGARSNGVVFVKNGVTVAVGSGQVERVGAVEQAIVKGIQKAMDREGIEYDPLLGITGYEQLNVQPFEGSVCSSDAFFPNRDSIDRLARVKVSAVVQPYGSIADAKIIDAANEHGIAMPATLERCFGHF